MLNVSLANVNAIVGNRRRHCVQSATLAPMPDTAGLERLYHYFPTLTARQRERFAALGALYQGWNAQINVISRKDMDALYERHVLHALAIARVQPFADGAIILDVGTGGGFPGIPLAILFEQVEFHLADSIGKKIKVVSEVSAALGLDNVTAHWARAEAVDIRFDFAVSRAVAPLINLASWVRPRVAKTQFHPLANGMLALKGGDLSEEIKLSGLKGVQQYPISAYFSEPFFDTKQVVYAPLR